MTRKDRELFSNRKKHDTTLICSFEIRIRDFVT